MSQISLSGWKSIICEHFQSLERAGGLGYVKRSFVLHTNKIAGDCAFPGNLMTFNQAVDEYIASGYLEKVNPGQSVLGFDLAITLDGISAFL